jgi:hypothetical protein
MSPHLALSIGATASILQLATPLLSPAGAQGFPTRFRAAIDDRVVALHDRLTDTTRVSALLPARSKPFGMDSRAWAGLSFSVRGTRLTNPPSFVVLTIESWTPARGGWAFPHPEPLLIRSGDSLRLEVPPAGYEKRRVHLFDTGRREMLWFNLAPSDMRCLARAPALLLKSGRAQFELRERGMEIVREVVRRMTPAGRGPQ